MRIELTVTLQFKLTEFCVCTTDEVPTRLPVRESPTVPVDPYNTVGGVSRLEHGISLMVLRFYNIWNDTWCI